VTSPAYYESSYPPEILRGYEAPEPPLVGAARRAATGYTGELTVTAGEPGAYEPDVAPADRPRNVTELRERARPVDTAPWPAEAYVLIGTSGKRAHWGGDDWHSGESPGYSPVVSTDGHGDETLEDDDEPEVEPEGDDE
jgi:hypothetical protein